MSTLHPHWQETDDADDRRVRVTAKATKSEAQSALPSSPPRVAQQASRRPAALTGIALFLIAGVAAFQGFNQLSIGGQVSAPTVNVHLRSTGADPVTITVQPGSTIIWTNDDAIPHILSSETLPTVDGKPFVSSSIFPGSSTHILIPLNAKLGAYAYISQTAQTISGQILIKDVAPTQNPTPVTTTTTQASSVPTTPAPTLSAQSSIAATPSQQAALPTDTSTPETPAPTASMIPVNPHTVANSPSLPERQSPGDPAISKVRTHPKSAPATGPEVWVTIGLSVGALLFLTRRSFGRA